MPIDPALAEALNLALVPIIWAGAAQRVFAPGIKPSVLVQVDAGDRPFVPTVLQAFQSDNPGATRAPLTFDDHAHAVIDLYQKLRAIAERGCDLGRSDLAYREG